MRTNNPLGDNCRIVSSESPASLAESKPKLARILFSKLCSPERGWRVAPQISGRVSFTYNHHQCCSSPSPRPHIPHHSTLRCPHIRFTLNHQRTHTSLFMPHWTMANALLSQVRMTINLLDLTFLPIHPLRFTPPHCKLNFFSC